MIIKAIKAALLGATIALLLIVGLLGLMNKYFVS
jgi:hypothetical protein